MSVKYNKFFHLLVDRKLAPSQVAAQAGVSHNIVTRMRRDEYVSLESIEKLCRVLGCTPDDILEFEEVNREEKK